MGTRRAAKGMDAEARRQALNEIDLAAVFRRIEDGNYLEPSDDESNEACTGGRGATRPSETINVRPPSKSR